ncbi:spc105-related isoform X2 [Haematobia irritans]|uniref:spc105-related isoform X2 n=1 Tax=Haematobia irritans TaxID=7368 RepID=UPI003F4F5AE1
MEKLKRRSSLRKSVYMRDEENTTYSCTPLLKRRISFSGKHLVREFHVEEEPKNWDNSYEISDRMNGEDLDSKFGSTDGTTIVADKSNNRTTPKNVSHIPQAAINESQKEANLCSTRDLINIPYQNTTFNIEHSVDIMLCESEKKYAREKKDSCLSHAENIRSFSLDDTTLLLLPHTQSIYFGEKTVDFMNDMQTRMDIPNNSTNCIKRKSNVYSETMPEVNLTEQLNNVKKDGETIYMNESIPSKNEYVTSNDNYGSSTIHMSETLKPKFSFPSEKFNHCKTIEMEISMEMAGKENIPPTETSIEKESKLFIEKINKLTALQTSEDIFTGCDEKFKNINTGSNGDQHSTIKSNEIVGKFTNNCNQEPKKSIMFGENIKDGSVPVITDPCLDMSHKNNRHPKLVVRKICTPITGQAKSNLIQRYKSKQENNENYKNICTPVINSNKSTLDFSINSSILLDCSSSPLIPAEYKLYNIKQFNDELEGGKIQLFPRTPNTDRKPKEVSCSRLSKQRKTLFFEDEIATDHNTSNNHNNSTVPYSSEFSVFKEGNDRRINMKCRFSQADDLLLDNTSFLAKARIGDETNSRNSTRRDFTKNHDETYNEVQIGKCIQMAGEPSEDISRKRLTMHINEDINITNTKIFEFSYESIDPVIDDGLHSGERVLEGNLTANKINGKEGIYIYSANSNNKESIGRTTHININKSTDHRPLLQSNTTNNIDATSNHRGTLNTFQEMDLNDNGKSNSKHRNTVLEPHAIEHSLIFNGLYPNATRQKLEVCEIDMGIIYEDDVEQILSEEDKADSILARDNMEIDETLNTISPNELLGDNNVLKDGTKSHVYTTLLQDQRSNDDNKIEMRNSQSRQTIFVNQDINIDESTQVAQFPINCYTKNVAQSPSEIIENIYTTASESRKDENNEVKCRLTLFTHHDMDIDNSMQNSTMNGHRQLRHDFSTINSNDVLDTGGHLVRNEISLQCKGVKGNELNETKSQALESTSPQIEIKDMRNKKEMRNPMCRQTILINQNIDLDESTQVLNQTKEPRNSNKYENKTTSSELKYASQTKAEDNAKSSSDLPTTQNERKNHKKVNNRFTLLTHHDMDVDYSIQNTTLNGQIKLQNDLKTDELPADYNFQRTGDNRNKSENKICLDAANNPIKYVDISLSSNANETINKNQNGLLDFDKLKYNIVNTTNWEQGLRGFENGDREHMYEETPCKSLAEFLNYENQLIQGESREADHVNISGGQHQTEISMKRLPIILTPVLSMAKKRNTWLARCDISDPMDVNIYDNNTRNIADVVSNEHYGDNDVSMQTPIKQKKNPKTDLFFNERKIDEKLDNSTIKECKLSQGTCFDDIENIAHSMQEVRKAVTASEPIVNEQTKLRTYNVISNEHWGGNGASIKTPINQKKHPETVLLANERKVDAKLLQLNDCTIKECELSQDIRLDDIENIAHSMQEVRKAVTASDPIVTELNRTCDVLHSGQNLLFEDNAITISDVSVYFKHNRESVVLEENTKGRSFQKHYMNLTLENIDQTRMSLVRSLSIDDENDAGLCSLDNNNLCLSLESSTHSGVPARMQESKSHTECRSIAFSATDKISNDEHKDKPANVSAVCRKCRHCQDTLTNESIHSRSDTFGLPPLPEIPTLDLDRLRRLRTRPHISDINHLWQRVSLDHTMPNLGNLSDLSDDTSIIIGPTLANPIQRLKVNVQLNSIPEYRSIKPSFSASLQELVRFQLPNWIIDCQLENKGVIAFGHKKLLTFSLIINYTEADPFGSEIQIQAIKLDNSSVPKKMKVEFSSEKFCAKQPRKQTSTPWWRRLNLELKY